MSSILFISQSRKPPSWSRKSVGRSVYDIFLFLFYTIPSYPQLPLVPFTYFHLFFSGCHRQMYYGISCPYRHWCHSNHHRQGTSQFLSYSNVHTHSDTCQISLFFIIFSWSIFYFSGKHVYLRTYITSTNTHNFFLSLFYIHIHYLSFHMLFAWLLCSHYHTYNLFIFLFWIDCEPKQQRHP